MGLFSFVRRAFVSISLAPSTRRIETIVADTPIKLEVSGLGIIFYSPFAAASIREGEDYLGQCFADPHFVEQQALAGRIVGVSTGTSGIFYLHLRSG
jgi:hypothetical protein